MNWFKKNLTTIILLAMAFLGAGLIAYPTFADWWNSFHQSRAVASYAETVAKMDYSHYDEVIYSAEEYNRQLGEMGIQFMLDEAQLAAYNAELDITGNGIMGYIDIPKIKITLPIYHGVSDAVLQVAIGHIEGTSLPVGGASSHCVVSGHRGLPSAKLFTDIDRLVVGDTWTVTVLNRTYTYEVDQIRVVVPTDLSDIAIEEGKDYFTLVTCTPYGINTHRLLVRGHRIENAQGEALVIADALQISTVFVAPFIAAPIIISLIAYMWVSTSYAGRMKKKREKAEAALKRRVKRIKKRSDKILGKAVRITRTRKCRKKKR